MSKFNKALVASGGVFTVLGSVTADGVVDAGDAVTVALAVVTAIGVFFVPNKKA